MLLRAYWEWVGGNIGALPLEAAITAVAGYVFRKRIKAAYERVRDTALKPVHERLAALKVTADKSHQIAADTHKHLTGKDHPDAPKSPGG